MVSRNVLTRWAHNVECQMNLMCFVCVVCHWRNKFYIQCSERRVLLRLAISFRLVFKFFMTYCYSCSGTKFWHMGRSLLSSPFFVSTSAAFLFWFLLWFDCMRFRSNCASKWSHWNWRLAALIVLCDDYSHSSVCLLLLFISSCRSSEIEISWLGSLSAYFSSSKSHNGTETETPSLALGICEFHQSYF